MNIWTKKFQHFIMFSKNNEGEVWLKKFGDDEIGTKKNSFFLMSKIKGKNFERKRKMNLNKKKKYS